MDSCGIPCPSCQASGVVARKLSVPSIIPAAPKLPTAEAWGATGLAAIKRSRPRRLEGRAEASIADVRCSRCSTPRKTDANPAVRHRHLFGVMLPARPVLVVNTRSGVQSEHDLVGESRHLALPAFLQGPLDTGHPDRSL